MIKKIYPILGLIIGVAVSVTAVHKPAIDSGNITEVSTAECINGMCFFTATSDSVPSDTVVPSIYGSHFLYGVDTKSSACDDHYHFSNGGWRDKAVLPVEKDHPAVMVTYFDHVGRTIRNRVGIIADSGSKIRTTTKQHTLRILGEFYESCMVADTLEPDLIKRRKKDSTVKDSTRQEQCIRRLMGNASEIAGQYFAEELQKTNAVARMEELLVTLKSEVIAMLKENKLMTEDERQYAVEKLNKLVLRVGIPKKLVDYSTLNLDPKDYHGNKKEIATFFLSVQNHSIGEDLRQQWKMSLLMPNAVFMSSDHAIEIPTLMFTPPFFYSTGEDAQNFAGVGYVIGHEIFHSVTSQIHSLENPKMKDEIKSFMDFSTSMGSLDGWIANGVRTFNEDVADLGGGRVAYRAWKSVMKKKNIKPKVIDGYSDDQRFFIALGKMWRSKWQGGAPNGDVHAPHFARVNMTVMQMPEFSKAFGCKEGDKMFVPQNKQSIIW